MKSENLRIEFEKYGIELEMIKGMLKLELELDLGLDLKLELELELELKLN